MSGIKNKAIGDAALEVLIAINQDKFLYEQNYSYGGRRIENISNELNWVNVKTFDLVGIKNVSINPSIMLRIGNVMEALKKRDLINCETPQRWLEGKTARVKKASGKLINLDRQKNVWSQIYTINEAGKQALLDMRSRVEALQIPKEDRFIISKRLSLSGEYLGGVSGFHRVVKETPSRFLLHNSTDTSWGYNAILEQVVIAGEVFHWLDKANTAIFNATFEQFTRFKASTHLLDQEVSVANEKMNQKIAPIITAHKREVNNIIGMLDQEMQAIDRVEDEEQGFVLEDDDLAGFKI